jgi:hypothetical protein
MYLPINNSRPIVAAPEITVMPTPVLVSIYLLLMFALALIVRRAYVRYREDGPSPKPEDLERQIKVPYSPPPERRKRAFDAGLRHI